MILLVNNNLKISKSSILTPLEQIFDNRIIDWIEDGVILNHQRQKYRERYRTKICKNCTDEQKKKRSCVVVDQELDKRSCGHMERAVLQKFVDKAKIHTISHPDNLRINNIHIEKNSH